jgi:hypothetical protein
VVSGRRRMIEIIADWRKNSDNRIYHQVASRGYHEHD